LHAPLPDENDTLFNLIGREGPMENAKVLKEGRIETAKDRLPSQITLRQTDDKTFATHLKVYPPDKEPYFILGRYFFSLQEAEADFAKRVQELSASMKGTK
jgi:hypothetical protein